MKLKPLIEVSVVQKGEIIKSITEALATRKDVVFSYLHGPFIESELFREVDVAVYCEPDDFEQRDVSHYERELSDELCKVARVPVVAHTLNNAPVGFFYNATRGRMLTTKDEQRRHDIVERVWVLYFNFKPSAKDFLKDMFPPKTKS